MANDDSFRQLPSDNPYYAPQVAPAGGYITRSELTLNPWTSIWTRPRATIRQIVDTDPMYMVIPLAILGGIVQAFDRASSRNLGDELPLGGIFVAALIGGPIGGLLSLYLAGWLLRVTGGWLSGKANAEKVRAAIAWGQVPAIATLPIIGVQIAVFGIEMFTEFTPRLDANDQLLYVLLATGIVELILGIWAIVAVIKCVAEVHEFSAWRALGAMFLAFFLVLGVVLIPIMLIGIMVGLAGAGR
jgi:hypothetical protein